MSQASALKTVRTGIIDALWQHYCSNNPLMHRILHHLAPRPIVLDHLAIIDLSSPNTGIPPLREVFSLLGYIEHGQGYLPDKQNRFLWMAEADCEALPATEVLPQVVVADFRNDALPDNIQSIISQYTAKVPPAPIDTMTRLLKQLQAGKASAISQLIELVVHYLTSRDWPLPTVSKFKTLQAFNELLAWVFVFGRRPNHFTLSIHHMTSLFPSLVDFQFFLENTIKTPINEEGGKIKGSKETGIEQGSTAGIVQRIPLKDGVIHLPTDFIEYVWRYPIHHTSPSVATPARWGDYFTGFIAQQANHVIQSLYPDSKKDTLCKVQG